MQKKYHHVHVRPAPMCISPTIDWSRVFSPNCHCCFSFFLAVDETDKSCPIRPALASTNIYYSGKLGTFSFVRKLKREMISFVTALYLSKLFQFSTFSPLTPLGCYDCVGIAIHSLIHKPIFFLLPIMEAFTKR